MNLQSHPIPSGFQNLDKIIGGFFPAEVTIIGSRPAIGKTSFILNVIKHICINKTAKPLLFSLEMPELNIRQRLTSIISNTPCYNIRKGLVDKKIILKADERISELIIDDTPDLRIDTLISKAMKYVQEDKCNIIFIDYLGLISSFKENAPVYEQIYTITKMLKTLAKQLNVPIVCTCQVARSIETGEPTLQSLRGSSSIEEDSDVIILIHRDRKVPDESHSSVDCSFIIAKNRNGDLGSVEGNFYKETVTFKEKE